MKAYKKIAKATIATLENRRDSQAKLEQEFVGTGPTRLPPSSSLDKTVIVVPGIARIIIAGKVKPVL